MKQEQEGEKEEEEINNCLLSSLFHTKWDTE